MFHCYYCNHILRFIPKFKPQPQRSQLWMGPKSEKHLVCTTCKTEYKVEITVIHQTGLGLERVEELRNKPSR